MQFYLCFGLSAYASTSLPLLIKHVHAFVSAQCHLYVVQFGELIINSNTKIESFVNESIDMELSAICAGALRKKKIIEALRKKKLRNGAHA
uniref:Putative secreted protein n=1 Tax=Anopheles darlingi TaxID=43151 RepID=A0A2M4DR97_ANODA